MSKLITKIKSKFHPSEPHSTDDVKRDDDTSSSSSEDEKLGQKKDRVPKWHSGKMYAVGDRVLYKKKTYKCTVAHTSEKMNNPMVNSTNWMIVSDIEKPLPDPTTPVDPVTPMTPTENF